jgi:hypothetical protein
LTLQKKHDITEVLQYYSMKELNDVVKKYVSGMKIRKVLMLHPDVPKRPSKKRFKRKLSQKKNKVQNHYVQNQLKMILSLGSFPCKHK